MKKILVIALALASVNAFGSRARMTALGNAEHLVDTQTVYMNPSDMFYVGGDFVNIESGTANTNTKGTNPEGLVVRSMGDAKLGLSIGHRSDNASSYPGGLRQGQILTGLGNANQQNPLELTYGMKAGDMAYAGTLVYSNYNDKVANAKESSAGVRLGMRMGAIDAAVGLGLMNTVDTPTSKFKGTLGITAEAGFTTDSMYLFGKVVAAGFKTENAGGTETAKVDTTDMQLGAISSVKKDGSEFFYGAKLVSTNAKNATGAGTKSTELNLPIFMGLEVDATSWLVLRGSVTQRLVLLNNTKVEAGTLVVTETSPGANSTVAALGAGLKFNKLTFDGTLSAGGASQKVDTTDLLGQVGVTYMF